MISGYTVIGTVLVFGLPENIPLNIFEMPYIQDMQYGKLFTILVLLFLCFCSAFAQHRLWYTQSAGNWDEALPLGNGRLGVMVFGDPQHERIQLNDDSMWPGDPGWKEPDGTPDDLAQIRQLLFEGKKS